MIAIDLSIQQALDADPKAIQQINFAGNLDQPAGATLFFINEEPKEIVLDFSQGTVKVFQFYVFLKYKMTQYNTLNVKQSKSQLNKLKSGIKNGSEVTLKLSSDVVGDSNEENNFLHKLLLTNTQVSKLRKAYANNSSANKIIKNSIA